MTMIRTRNWRFYALLVAVAAVVAVGYVSWRAAVDLLRPAWAPPDARPFTVIQVVDGDTVLARDGDRGPTVRIRYNGIDAPEVTTGEPFADEATAANRQMVEGRRIWVSTDVQEVDVHGRLLGYVFADGRFVNKELVARGYAEVMIIAPNLRYRDELLAAQAEARAAGRGMWGDVKEPASSAELALHAGGVVRLRGKVRGVVPGAQDRPTMFRIEPFSASEEGDGAAVAPRPPTVTVLLFPEFRDRFPKDLERDLAGQTVELTGRLKMTNGRFEIALREPGQLQVLVRTN